MKKYLTYLFVLLGANLMTAEEVAQPHPVEQKVFTVTVTPKQGQVIRELVETMGETSLFSLAFKKTYLRNLAKQLRPVSSTQFLGYVFERTDLIEHMKSISKSYKKKKNLTRSIVRGLKKENNENLREDIPSFAKFTKSNKNILNIMATEEDWNGFIVHLLEQN